MMHHRKPMPCLHRAAKYKASSFVANAVVSWLMVTQFSVTIKGALTSIVAGRLLQLSNLVAKFQLTWTIVLKYAMNFGAFCGCLVVSTARRSTQSIMRYQLWGLLERVTLQQEFLAFLRHQDSGKNSLISIYSPWRICLGIAHSRNCLLLPTG